MERSGVAEEKRRIKDAIASLNIDKRAIELEQARITAQLKSGWMPHLQKQNLFARKMELNKKLLKIQEAAMPLKSELGQWKTIDAELHSKEQLAYCEAVSSVQAVVKMDGMPGRVVELKEKYLRFAEDGTRISSMRLMAAQFARELEDLLCGPE